MKNAKRRYEHGQGLVRGKTTSSRTQPKTTILGPKQGIGETTYPRFNALVHGWTPSDSWLKIWHTTTTN